MKSLSELKIGDPVERNMAGVIMKLKVSEVIGDYIYCGPWKFSMKNGAEIDEDLEWDENRSGSVIRIIK
jgi:hypothetical protein